MPKTKTSPTVWTVDRFNENVIKSQNGCWYLPTNKTRAHVIAYRLFVGAIPVDQVKGASTVARFVCHKCDSPSCCNPEHLFLGSAKDNNLDRATKGRSYRPFGDLNVMKRPELREKRTGEGNPMFGRKHSRESVAKIVAAHTGDLSHSKRPEVRAKLSQSGKLVANVVCEVCKREMKPWSYARWHKGRCNG